MNASGLGIVAIARLYLPVREARLPDGTTNNRGLRVEAIQHWSGGQFGDSWCMEMAWLWVDQHLADPDIETWFPRQQSVENFRQYAKAQGWEIPDVPNAGDLCVSVADDHGHHIGLVTVVNPKLTTIAGNTSADGTSSNGDRCAEHPVALADKEFFRVPGVIA